MKRQKELTNLRWYCNLAIDGARLQHERLLHGNTSRSDMDFYLLCVWRLSEIARRAATYGVEDAKGIQAEMHARWPSIEDVRNWWLHAKSIESTGWTTWFSDGIYRLKSDGSAEPIIHMEDHEEVQRFYERLCEALGPLPDETP